MAIQSNRISDFVRQLGLHFIIKERLIKYSVKMYVLDRDHLQRTV